MMIALPVASTTVLAVLAYTFWQLHDVQARLDTVVATSATTPSSVPTPTVTVTATATVTQTVTQTAAIVPTQTVKPSAASSAAPPMGQVALLGPGSNGNYGQGGSTNRQCSSWRIGVVNQSDTAIKNLIFPGEESSYSSFADGGGEVEARQPAAVTVDLFVAAGDSAVARFATCTTTPPPSDPDYSFSMTAPSEVKYTWATGQVGRACYGWTC